MGAYPETPGVDRALGSGYSPGFPARVDPYRLRTPGRLDVFFCGQDTHERRHAAVNAARAAAPADRRLVRPTDAFLADGSGDRGGLDAESYALAMSETKVAPCPSGPASPDSFRLYEALEAGAVPVADGSTPTGPVTGYWTSVFGELPPFPVLDDWDELAEHVDRVRRTWPVEATRVHAWWLQWKRRLAHDLHRAVSDLSGADPERGASPADHVTASSSQHRSTRIHRPR